MPPRKKSKVQTAKPQTTATSFNNTTKEAAINQYGTDIASIPSQNFAIARTEHRYFEPNTSVRESYTRSDYEYFRPEEATPKRYKEIMLAVENAYKKVAIVRNVVDLMADFITEGISVSHPIPKIERFNRAWFKKVKGQSLSNRFCVQLYSASNVLVHPQYTKINQSAVEQIQTSFGALSSPRDQFPVGYSLIHPLYTELLNEEIATFVGKYEFAIKMPEQVKAYLNNKNVKLNKAEIPKLILDAAKSKDGLLPVDLLPFFYKKMDWETWAYPMLGPILGDLVYLEKMKLADISALDGAMTQIRLWKLGNLEKGILPKPAAINKLNEILLSNVGGGVMDLIWGPDIELAESKASAELYKFLGSDKYQFVMSAVYEGLGLPYNKSVSNSVNSLKVFMSRLNEGRVQLTDFWNAELKKVQLAMGFKEAATITFKHPVIDDENAEKALWIQLADRDMIPIEMVQERFNIDTRIAHAKLRKQKVRTKRMNRVGPYFDSQPDISMKKILLQNGEVAPSEIGVKLDPKKDGELSRMDRMEKAAKEEAKLAGKESPPQFDKPAPKESENGRPIGRKDSGARKTRSDKQSMAMYAWAKGAQAVVGETLTPNYLAMKEKKNLRQLSAGEHKELETIKFQTLAAIQPFSAVTKETVYAAVRSPLNIELILSHQESIDGIELSVETEREIQLQNYVKYYNSI